MKSKEVLKMLKRTKKYVVLAAICCFLPGLGGCGDSVAALPEIEEVVQEEASFTADSDSQDEPQGEYAQTENLESKKGSEDGFAEEEGEGVPEAVHTHIYDEGAVTRQASCEEDGTVLYTCAVCGETREEAKPAYGHTEGGWEVILEPTEDTEGIQAKKCTECGVSLATELIPMIAHEHSFDTEIEHVDAGCEEDGHILYQCACGDTKEEVLPAIGHDEGTWTTVKEPTYIEMGKEELRCGACNALLDSHELDVISHEHDYEVTTHKAASCTEDGFDILACSICHDQKTEAIPATGHTGSGMKEVTAATCEKDGLRQNICTECGETLDSEIIPAAGHTESGMAEVSAAACEKDGLKQNTCTECGEVLGAETIPAKGHQYGGWIVETEPTEEAGGVKYKVCSVCGDRITEDIPAAEPHVHSYAETGRTESTCTAAGHVTYTCPECGESYDEPLALAAHTPGEWVTVTEPTEEAGGLKQQSCTVCGTVMAEESIPKLEHTHSYQAVVTDASCTEDGKIVYTCACGGSYEETIKAAGHSYGEPVTVNASCTKAGRVTRTCEVCGREDVTEIPAAGHAYQQTAVTEADCEHEGSVTWTCANCKDSYKETLPKTEHEYYEFSRQDATCTKDGKVIKMCEHCGDTIREAIPMAGHDEGSWETVKEPEVGINGEEARKCGKCGYILETRKLDMLMTDGVDSVYYVTLDDGSEVMVIGHIDTARADAMFNRINAYRQENGLPALARAADLTEFAQIRAVEISQLFDHVRPDGSGLPSRVGENIAMNGYTGDLETSVNATFNQWKNSPGHNKGMLDTSYKSMELGCFLMREKTIYGYAYRYAYWVTNFKL